MLCFSEQQQQVAAALNAVMVLSVTRQGLSEAVLIGHSMGGKAAAMTALLHPEVVRGLVIMDIAPVSYSM